MSLTPLEQSRAWLDRLTADEVAAIIGCATSVAENYKMGKPTLPLKSFDLIAQEMAKRTPASPTMPESVTEVANTVLETELDVVSKNLLGVISERDELAAKLERTYAELESLKSKPAAPECDTPPAEWLIKYASSTSGNTGAAPPQEERIILDPIPEGVRVMILTPTHGGITEQTRHCLESTVRRFPDKVLTISPPPSHKLEWSRNRLTARWYESGVPWALWIDGDTVFPCAEPGWFKETVADSRTWGNSFTEIHALDRLLFSAIGAANGGTSDKPQHTIMAGVYFDRKGKAVPMFAKGKENEMIASRLRSQGPRNEVSDAGDWAGTGILLVHRSVITDIIRTQPETAVANPESKPHLGYSHDLFASIDDSSDDVSFCYRAREAGHKIMVDYAVMAAHVGTYCFANRKIIP